jgi:lactate dehydrogenase-like 2-hydroxyacid dehydrogenase
MTKPAVLAAAPFPPFTMEPLGQAFAVHRLWEGLDDEAAGSIRALATNTLFGRLGAETMDRLPQLEIIANFGVGYDNIDVAAAAARGVVVTNTGGVLDEEVADLTLGLLLSTVRRLPQAERHLRAGLWEQGAFPLSPTLRGRRVGILGLGAIGKAVARRLEGFGVAIAYHGRTRQEGVAYPWYPTPVALAQAVDVLVVIVPGGPDTTALVDAAVLAALGPQGVLINVSRGSVVDEAALIAALQQGTILAAGLDVFAREPHVPAALLAQDNAVLLPHVGSGSVATRTAMGQLMIDNLSAWFETGRALTPVPETRHLQARKAG